MHTSERCGASAQLCLCVSWGTGRHWWGGLPLHICELIHCCPEDPPAERLPRQLHPEGRADGKLEQALILGQGKNILFPLLSKNMLRPFLSLDAIKTSCGSEGPQPSPEEKENKNSMGAESPLVSRPLRPDSSHLRAEPCPKGPLNSICLFILMTAQGTRCHIGLTLFNSWC